jgi:hypothetical protein
MGHPGKPLVQGIDALVHAARGFLLEDSVLSVSSELQVGDHETRHVGRGRGERSRGPEIADELEMPRLESAVLAPVGGGHVGRERLGKGLAKGASRHAQRIENVFSTYSNDNPETFATMNRRARPRSSKDEYVKAASPASM